MIELEILINDSSNTVMRLSSFQDDSYYSSLVNLDASLQSSTRFNDQKRYSLEKLKFNKQKLRTISNLKENWNGYHGKVIEEKTIQNIEKLLTQLEYQPQIFPTGRGTIQIEDFIDDNNFYEIEVWNNLANVYQVKNSEELEKEEINFDNIAELIDRFYVG